MAGFTAFFAFWRVFPKQPMLFSPGFQGVVAFARIRCPYSSGKRRFFGRVFAEAYRRWFGNECWVTDRIEIKLGGCLKECGFDIHIGVPLQYICTLTPPRYHHRGPVSSGTFEVRSQVVVG
jgi:hypothetical protein